MIDEAGKVNTCSAPSKLEITDMRFAEIVGAPMRCILMKLFTNQGLVGYGEVRDGASATYALMLKSRLLGENPCDVDRLFRKIKQFGGHARQGGGVSAVEVALWDLAGKAYGVPVYRMLGGRFRDRVRVYCDTDAGSRDTGEAMGKALAKRMQRGFTFLKMDLGIGKLASVPGALCAPSGYDTRNTPHPFTGVRITAKGLDLLEEYVAEVRGVIGYEVPLAIDHLGHIGVEECIALANRLEKYSLAWIEDPIPWHYTEQYVRLSGATTLPICTGEDVYLKEGFAPMLERRAVAIIHPDLLTVGGILETKKVGDAAQEAGVAMAIHMAESPIGCLAAAHAALATENFLALEFHSADVPWWDDLVSGPAKPIVRNGYIELTDAPGLGIGELEDEVIGEHLAPECLAWAPTGRWNQEHSHDRLWS